MNRILALAPIVALLAACAPKAVTKTAAAPAPAPVAAAAAPSPAAAPAPAAEAAKAAPSGPSHKVWGVIDSIDAVASKVAVKDKRGKVHQLALASDAKVTRGGQEKAEGLADVKAGDAVTVSAVGDTAVAIHVRVLSASESHVAKAKQPPPRPQRESISMIIRMGSRPISSTSRL